MTAARGIPVALSHVSKSYGAVAAVADCTLDIPEGAFVTLLGPSGSGKTSLLNVIAGFLRPDRGDVLFAGHSVLDVPTHRRNIGMVFQSYALFPHMSVFDNVAFPLRMRGQGLAPPAIAHRVLQTLAMVRLGGYEQRLPAALSGGQRQRVAMARALVSTPPLLLLDEPLSALDKDLREQLQVELKAIHREAGSTFVCVTHDQQEALGMSDLVVVMNKGRIQQTGTPRALWRAPASAFVARFLGGANLVPARADAGAWRLSDGTLVRAGRTAPGANGAAEIVFRPEQVSVAPAAPAGGGLNHAVVRVSETIFAGETARLVATLGGVEISARLPIDEAARLASGQSVGLAWPVAETAALPPAET
jgi:ABC-type Fe3+/spermidine/putrescine transport system ATPase subunit